MKRKLLRVLHIMRCFTLIIILGASVAIISKLVLPEKSIYIKPKNIYIELKKGTSYQINNLSDFKYLFYKSSDENIATVNQEGVVYAVNPGNATITIDSNNGEKINVAVDVYTTEILPSGIKLNITNKSINVGETVNLKATISPSNATNKSVTWTSSDNSIATVENGVVKAKKAGKVTITAKTSTNISARATINVMAPEEPVKSYFDIYMLNVYDSKAMTGGTDYKEDIGQSLIVKTKDNKYILYDTSHNNVKITDFIYNQLKKIQNTDKVVIDYMIISHSHSDHSGGAVNLINNKNIEIKNLIIKKESKREATYNKIAGKFSSDKIVKLTEEGMKIDIDSNVEMYLFNIGDVYKSVKSSCKTGYVMQYNTNSQVKKKINGHYYYVDGSKYPNFEVIETDELIDKSVGKMDRYFYAVYIKGIENCNDNANSIAALFKVKTNKGNKYAYIPGDLYNNGYSFRATDGIFGDDSSTIFEQPADIKYSQETKSFTGNLPEIKVPSETNAAKAIKNKIGNDVNNIVIYQSTHHGGNNAPDAINILNLNRSDVFVLDPNRNDPSKEITLFIARSYYYSLSKTKTFYGGGINKEGVHCNINSDASYNCKEY